jgi:hypothetical protein
MKRLLILFFLLGGLGAWSPLPAQVISGPVVSSEGLVSYVGRQRTIFETGRADAVTSLSILDGLPNVYALGPVDGLDGEITVFRSKPYVSKVTGPGSRDFSVDHTTQHGAIFLAWAQNEHWQELAVPETVTTFSALGDFVKTSALDRGWDSKQPFPFLLRGKARLITWHINVNRTQGRPITRELFRKSKQSYRLQDEQCDIFGLYSERHAGVFLSQGFTIHIHLVSRDSAATGHIDEIDPSGLTLSLPHFRESIRAQPPPRTSSVSRPPINNPAQF